MVQWNPVVAARKPQVSSQQSSHLNSLVVKKNSAHVCKADHYQVSLYMHSIKVKSYCHECYE